MECAIRSRRGPPEVVRTKLHQKYLDIIVVETFIDTGDNLSTHATLEKLHRSTRVMKPTRAL